MSHTRMSENYIWSEKEAVGVGATGTVYKCHSKKTGDVFAAKVFARQAENGIDKRREIETLKKLRHKNIVTLFSLERETSSNSTVVIMEYCHSNLHEVLLLPQNSRGLADSMFINVVRDITCAFEYLRNNNIVHRDLKPGNILQTYDARGGYLYKITDFGTARELGETDMFVSVVGTEEYLHPDIYARAIMQHQNKTNFTAKVDLWSLGCMFYHLATGRIPFAPQGGRSNKEIMFKMTSEKSADVISCEQHPSTGELLYSRQLPATSRLSPAFRDALTPVLQQLLETQSDLSYSYDEFFAVIKDMLNKKPSTVFLSHICSSTIVYGDKKLSELHENCSKAIYEQKTVSLDTSCLEYETNDKRPLICLIDTPSDDTPSTNATFTWSEITKKSVPAHFAKRHLDVAHSAKQFVEKTLTDLHIVQSTESLLRTRLEERLASVGKWRTEGFAKSDSRNHQLITNTSLLEKMRADISGFRDIDTIKYYSEIKETYRKYDVIREKNKNLEEQVFPNPFPLLDVIDFHVTMIDEICREVKKEKQLSGNPLADLKWTNHKKRLLSSDIRIKEVVNDVTAKHSAAQLNFQTVYRNVKELENELENFEEEFKKNNTQFDSYFQKSLQHFENEVLGYISTTQDSKEMHNLEQQLKLLDGCLPNLLSMAETQRKQLESLSRLGFE